VLLRTWLEVKDREEVRLPDDMEDLVEAVYGERSCPFAPGEPLADHWQKTRQESEAKVVQETREAAQRWLRKPSYRGEIWELCQEPREEDAPDFHVAHQALTRLAEPSVSIVCLYGDEARPSFDREGRDALDPRARPDLALAARLLGRSVQVADRRALEALLARQVPSGWRDCALLRHHHLVTLDAAGGADLDRWRLLLDPEVGLEIVDRT
jgi:CRISPR-associated endonuclease/helicase Cas3